MQGKSAYFRDTISQMLGTSQRHPCGGFMSQENTPGTVPPNPVGDRHGSRTPHSVYTNRKYTCSFFSFFIERVLARLTTFFDDQVASMASANTHSESNSNVPADVDDAGPQHGTQNLLS